MIHSMLSVVISMPPCSIIDLFIYLFIDEYIQSIEWCIYEWLKIDVWIDVYLDRLLRRHVEDTMG